MPRCQGVGTPAWRRPPELYSISISISIIYTHLIISVFWFGLPKSAKIWPTRKHLSRIPALSSPAAFLVFYRNNPKHSAGSCDKSRIAFQMTSWTEVLASEWEEETTLHHSFRCRDTFRTPNVWNGSMTMSDRKLLSHALPELAGCKWMPFRSIKFIHVIYHILFCILYIRIVISCHIHLYQPAGHVSSCAIPLGAVKVADFPFWPTMEPRQMASRSSGKSPGFNVLRCTWCTFQWLSMYYCAVLWLSVCPIPPSKSGSSITLVHHCRIVHHCSSCEHPIQNITPLRHFHNHSSRPNMGVAAVASDPAMLQSGNNKDLVRRVISVYLSLTFSLQYTWFCSAYIIGCQRFEPA